MAQVRAVDSEGHESTLFDGTVYECECWIRGNERNYQDSILWVIGNSSEMADYGEGNSEDYNIYD